MATTPQISLCHRLYEGNPIQGLISLSLNPHKDLQKENFDINGREIEAMTNHVDDGIDVAQQKLTIQDDLLKDKEKEMDHGNIQPNTNVHLSWNNIIEDSTRIMVMEKEEGSPSTR